ncbi:hypothetical protein CVT25_003898 [Psilocybe cyanescens]|uniref:Uncharacterized protein n=1 Tax=Psilocybe cyanescens TaxID=93625 RepID=A0A409XIV1_PSICY|nr:hypothetical protein CVT25_003898 [Psilocybe cyanescens]
MEDIFVEGLRLACGSPAVPDASPACTRPAAGYGSTAGTASFSAAQPSNNQPAAGSRTAPVVVPASISMEGATGGAGMSPSSSSPPAATTSSGAEREQLTFVGATPTSSASSAASATANPSTSTSTQPTTTTASDNNATALPAAIIQDLQSQLAGHFERVCHLAGVISEQ